MEDCDLQDDINPFFPACFGAWYLPQQQDKAQHILGHHLHFHESESVHIRIISLHAFVCLPSVSRVAIVSKSFEGKTDRTEQWYGTQYKQEAIPEEVIQVG